jgi:hypothetical protein
MSKYERNKGAAAERDAAKLWREIGFPFAKRNITQYQSKSGRDLSDTKPFLVQCKCGKHINVWEALSEATMEAKAEEIPLAMVRKDRDEWVVVIKWHDFVKVLNPK